MPDQRPLTEVAVGLVFDRHGRVLLGQRPEGKPYAGWWEFPGGKVEAGETVAAALARELHEELGIRVRASTPWIVREHSYPHARVRLHFRRVFDWHGEPVAREGQAFGWTRPDAIDRGPLLPATVPILGMLALPGRMVALAVDRLADRAPSERPAGRGTPPGSPAGRARGDPRILLVADLANTAGGAGSGGWTDPGELASRMRRLRAVPGGVLCAGPGLLAQSGPGGRLLEACDDIVAPADRLPGRDAMPGLRGLRIDRIDDLRQITQVDADFAVVVADVSARSRAFDEALGLAPMPVYLAIGGGRNAGCRPSGLQGLATGRWPGA